MTAALQISSSSDNRESLHPHFRLLAFDNELLKTVAGKGKWPLANAAQMNELRGIQKINIVIIAGRRHTHTPITGKPRIHLQCNK
jgi:hypothetical protein